MALKGVSNFLLVFQGGVKRSRLLVTKQWVFVEGDEDTARCCGFSFGLPVFTANELLQKILDENFDEPSVIWGKVEDDDVWQCIGLLNCSWGCSSPPCQPWSNSGTQGGLNEPDGHIFLKTLEMTGNLKVKVLLAEKRQRICNSP